MTLPDLLKKWKKEFWLSKVAKMSGYSRTPLHLIVESWEVSEKQKIAIIENITEYIEKLIKDLNSVE